MEFKTLEEKCKFYRGLTDYKLEPKQHNIIMLDGRSFSKMIKNKYKRPFDDEFINMMNETAIYVCKNVQGCKIGYVQSDEISLYFTDIDTEKTSLFFGGRLCKIQSIVASLAAAKFNQLAFANAIKKRSYAVKKMDDDETLYSLSDATSAILEMEPVQFDCKVWSVPTINDVYAWFLFRQNDCIKNSKQQASQTYCSHKELLNLTTDEQIKVLKDKTGIDWNTSYDDGKKYGRLITRVSKEITTTVKIQDSEETVSCVRKSWAAENSFVFNENRQLFLKLLENEK